MKLVPLILFLTLFGSTAQAQQVWALDSCFGTNGTTVTDLGFFWEPGLWLTLQDDGKIVGAASTEANGNVDFVILRYTSEGFLDPTFGVNGVFRMAGGNSQSVVLQPDQKIIVSGQNGQHPGSSSYALLRLNIDGTLDTTFGSNGIVSTELGIGYYSYRAIETIVQPDGKIVQSGTVINVGVGADFTIARYESDGSLDTTFGENGVVREEQLVAGEIHNLSIQADGKLVTSGRLRNGSSMDFVLKRYLSDGMVDSTFGINGTVLTDIGNDDEYGSSMHILANGKILLTGRVDSQRDFWLLRYNSDGTLDNSFGSGGMVSTDFGNSEIASWIIPLSNGQIVLAGWTSSPSNSDFHRDIAISKYYSDGALDTNFGINGKIIASIGNEDAYYFSGAEQPDGKLLFFGMAGGDIVVSRYTNVQCERTTLDEVFRETALHVFPNPANEFINVSLNDQFSFDKMKFVIHNVQGQVVSKGRLQSEKSSISLNGLITGVYFISITNDIRTYRQKLIVE